MLDATSRLLPVASNFMRQIAPSVVATLIAAGLIAGYNSAFHGHLVQPRMGMMKTEPAADPTPSQATTTVAMTKQPAKPVTEVITIHEYVTEPERTFDKPDGREAGKDQTKLKVADAPPAQTAPAPAAQPVPAAAPPRVVALPKPAPRTAEPPRQDPRVVSAAPITPAVVQAPPPVIMAAPPAQPPVAYEPPAVVTAKPMVTVPDRQRPAYEPQRPAYDAARAPYDPRAPYEPQQAEIDAPPPPKPASGPLGIIANTLSPAAWFARAREFGERIERAGNDILPDIRQQPAQAPQQ